MKATYDVVIIGGGATGGSTACFLAAEPGFDGSVLVVERDPTYEHAPSARASGGFRQQFSTPENIKIGLFGAHFVKNIEQYLAVDDKAPDVGFREHGYLMLTTPQAYPVMHENNVTQLDCGADIQFQDREALKARFPWLHVDGLAGGFLGVSNEGWLDPYSLTQAYKHKARDAGVDYVTDEAVTVSYAGRRVDSVTLRDGGRIEAGVVINAAGARDAAKIAAQVGVELPVEPRKRCTFIFECREEIGVTPLTITPNGVAVSPRGTRIPGQHRAAAGKGSGLRGRRDRALALRRHYLARAGGTGACLRSDQGDRGLGVATTTSTRWTKTSSSAGLRIWTTSTWPPGSPVTGCNNPRPSAGP